MSEQRQKDEAWGKTCADMMGALSRMDADGLRAHTAFMRKRKSDYQVTKIMPHNMGLRSTWDNGVKVMAHPLCVLLERVKLCTEEEYLRKEEGDVRTDGDQPERVYDAVGVVVGDWGINPNMVFTANEYRPLHALREYNAREAIREIFAKYTIESTPLSWLIYLRRGDRRSEVNTRAAMRRLLELGADPNVPFHLIIQHTAVLHRHDVEANARRGHSILSAAMESYCDIESVEMLLDFGARFRKDDPQPLCTAIAVYGAEVAVPLFHRYWRTAQVTPHDVLTQDPDVDDGGTAMHMIAGYPPICLGENDPTMANKIGRAHV